MMGRTKSLARNQLTVLNALELFRQLPDVDATVHEGPLSCVPAPVALIDDLPHTPNHLNCPACNAFNAALQVQRKNIASLTFGEARLYWSARRLQVNSLKGGTHERDDAYLDALEHFFVGLRLREITPGHLRAYQIARRKNCLRVDDADTRPWRRAAENSTINHELALLGRMLVHCRLWKNLKEYYFPLPVPRWSPRTIMEESEEAEFFARGALDQQARLAYLVACLTNNTTAAGSELRFLRLKHIFLRPAREISEIYIPPEGCKNESRPRKIALNRTARAAVHELLQRAIRLGCCAPDHFLFPFWIKRGLYDPARPASKTFLRKSWARLRLVTGRPDLRPHDLRHHCITRMLEEGEDPETVRSIAGHLRPEMTEYYSHQRKRVKYRAVARIDPSAKKPPASAEPATVKRGSPRRSA